MAPEPQHATEVQIEAPPAAARAAVLVALQGPRAPVEAIQVGRLLAAAAGAPLHGLFVWPLCIPAVEVPRLLELPPEALAGMVIDVAVGDPAERLVAAIAGVRGLAGGGSEAAVRPLFAVVPAAAEGSDPFALGPLAARALTAGPGRVVVVRPVVAPARLRRILVPLDGAPSTACAIRPASELARAAGAGLDILFVGAAEPSAEPGGMSQPRYVDQPQHEWAAFSDEFLQRFVGAIAHCHPDVQTRLFLGRGDPANEILRHCDSLGCDLLALTWHGALTDEHGAVFRRVVRRARLPVLVLRGATGAPASSVSHLG